MELPVRNQNGDVVDTAEVSDDLFAVPMNQSLVHQAMVMYAQGNNSYYPGLDNTGAIVDATVEYRFKVLKLFLEPVEKHALAKPSLVGPMHAG